MKKVVLVLVATAGILLGNGIAHASDLMVASAMQRCTTNEECALVTNSCADNCGFVPVNKMNLATLQQTYQQRCGKPMEANPQCNLNPPIAAACINSRCTIDYAYANNAGPKDYQSGAYPVPEAAVPSKVPASAAPANDRQGYTAYQIPQNEVREGSLGTIYVPSNAPVKGGNYVPVTPGQQPFVAPAPVAPAAPAPTAAPVAPRAGIAPYAPTAATYATPPVVKPATLVTPTVATQEATTPVPAPVAVPAAAPTPVPTATTTPKQIATPTNPIPSSASDRIPEPRVPQEEPMLKGTSPDTGNVNAPIPPSEYKSQTFVPPAGSTSPVAPEDPGAKPPEGTVLIAPTPRGPDETPTFGTKTKTEGKTYN